MSTLTNAIIFDGYIWDKDVKKLESDSYSGPVDVGWHCSDRSPMTYVYIRSTELTAYRGDLQPLRTTDVDPEWNGQLNAFLAEHGVQPPDGQQPGWWLCSWWG